MAPCEHGVSCSHPRTLPFVSLVVLASTAIASGLLAVILTSVNMLRHKRYNLHPLLAKYTMRILFMVPLYSVSSAASLLVRQHNLAQVLEVTRMLFESVVIFSFLQYILVCAGGVQALICSFEKPMRRGRAKKVSGASSQAAAAAPLGSRAGAESEDNCSSDDSGTSEDLGDGSSTTEAEGTSGEEAVVVATLDLALGSGETSSEAEDDCERGASCCSAGLKQPQQLPLLDRCLPRWRSARQMLKWCIRGTLCYIIVGILYSFVRVVFFVVETATGDRNPPSKAVVLLVAKVFLVASQGCAITALTTMGYNMKEDLKPLHGHWKFLSVKLVIFFTFWQGLLLSLLQSLGALQPMVDSALHWSSPKDVAAALQNWLICLEMLVASILHFRVWPPHDYLTMLAHIEIRRDRLVSADTQMTAPRTLAVDLRDIYHTAEMVMRTRSAE